jgi:hypothetical protein
MDNYPPVIPGVTETGSGTETMRAIASMVRMKPSKVIQMLAHLRPLFTPTPPPLEPLASGPQPVQNGQALTSPVSQLMGMGM